MTFISVIWKCDSWIINSALTFLVRGLHHHAQKNRCDFKDITKPNYRVSRNIPSVTTSFPLSPQAWPSKFPADTKCFTFCRGLERETHFVIVCKICHAMPKVSCRDREVLYGELHYYPGSAHPHNGLLLISMTSHLFVETFYANLAWVTTTSIIKLKYSKWNLCWFKGHQCYFLALNSMLLLS